MKYAIGLSLQEICKLDDFACELTLDYTATGFTTRKLIIDEGLPFGEWFNPTRRLLSNLIIQIIQTQVIKCSSPKNAAEDLIKLILNPPIPLLDVCQEIKSFLDDSCARVLDHFRKYNIYLTI
jgi:hypothetical protein